MKKKVKSRQLKFMRKRCQQFLNEKGVVTGHQYHEVVEAAERLLKIKPVDRSKSNSNCYIRFCVIYRQLTGREVPTFNSIVSLTLWERRKIKEEKLDFTSSMNVKISRFYDSFAWKQLRYATLKRYGPVCMACGATEQLNVDHIKPLRKYWKLRLDPENVQVLCGQCNHGKGNWDKTDWRPRCEPIKNNACN